MPYNIRKFIVENRNLRQSLNSARQTYSDRMSSGNYNFLVEISSPFQSSEDLLITPDHQLSSADLLRKIKYIESRLPIASELITPEQNMVKTIAIKATIANVTKAQESIKNEIANLARIANNKRWYDFVHMAKSSFATMYKRPFSNWKIGSGFLFVTGYIGFIPILAMTAVSSFLLTLKAGIEAKYEIFPYLKDRLALLNQINLDPIAKLRLYQESFVASNNDVVAKKYTVYEQLFDYSIGNWLNSKKQQYVVPLLAVKDETLAVKKRTEDASSASLKTFFGLTLISGALLLASLLIFGFTGPLLLLALPTALSVGVIGAVIVAGLKYKYPENKAVDAAVNYFNIPIKFVSWVLNKISYPFRAFQAKFKTTDNEVITELPVEPSVKAGNTVYEEPKRNSLSFSNPSNSSMSASLQNEENSPRLPSSSVARGLSID